MHPTTAVLVVEIADSTIAQDRLTKAAIYAGANVPEYLIVNLRDGCVEELTAPDPRKRLYAKRRVARRGQTIALVGKPGGRVKVTDLLPRR